MSKLIRLSLTGCLALSMLGCATLPFGLGGKAPVAPTTLGNRASLHLRLATLRSTQSLEGVHYKVRLEWLKVDGSYRKTQSLEDPTTTESWAPNPEESWSPNPEESWDPYQSPDPQYSPGGTYGSPQPSYPPIGNTGGPGNWDTAVPLSDPAPQEMDVDGFGNVTFTDLQPGTVRVTGLALDANDVEVGRARQNLNLAPGTQAEANLNLMIGGDAAFDLGIGFATEWMDIRYDQGSDGYGNEFRESSTPPDAWFRVVTDTATAAMHVTSEWDSATHAMLAYRQFGNQPREALGPAERVWFGIPTSHTVQESSPVPNWAHTRQYQFHPGNGSQGTITRWFAPHVGLIQETFESADGQHHVTMTRFTSPPPVWGPDPSPTPSAETSNTGESSPQPSVSAS